MNKISELNDEFRTTFERGTVLTSGDIIKKKPQEWIKILTAVQKFDDFTPDNDPYGEHDMGIVEVDGQDYIWKIDYYDLEDKYFSSDPSNPAVTHRVLTITTDY